jgi:putative ABC transport system ATP-binding protein
VNKVLEVINLDKYYSNGNNVTKAVNNFNFTVNKGEYIGIMGASGSGKTTLLNCISTIDKPTAGQILIDGIDVTKMNENMRSRFRSEKLGFVFQDFNLLDTFTGFENIALALSIEKKPISYIDKKVKRISDMLTISDVIEKYPYQMSGGEKQRVAVARALVTDPTLILADEPTGALDSRSARKLLESFQILNESISSTILMVTHDAFSASYCKRIIFIRDGKIFSELIRGQETRKNFFNRIVEVISLLGGDVNVE